jgi:hypothetical protein
MEHDDFPKKFLLEIVEYSGIGIYNISKYYVEVNMGGAICKISVRIALSMLKYQIVKHYLRSIIFPEAVKLFACKR